MGISRRNRARVINGGLALVSTCVTLAALESTFRLLDLRGYHEPRTRDWEHALVPEAERLPDVGIQFRPGSAFALRYDSDPRGYFDPDFGGDADFGLVYRINEHGFRGPGYPLARSPGVRRVVVLGDSFAFGEGVRFEDTLGERLEAGLGDGVEVLNLAVSGAGTLAELSYLKHRGLAFSPDLVLLVYVLNDAGAGGLNLWEDFKEQYEKRWLRGSYLASYVYARFGRRLLARDYVDGLVESAKQELPKWQRSLRRLSEARDLTASVGARFAVVIFPFLYQLDDRYPFAEFHRMIARHCRNEGIAVLDLFDALEGRTDVELWVHPSDQHPNEIAHGIAAEAIREFVTTRDLLRPAD